MKYLFPLQLNYQKNAVVLKKLSVWLVIFWRKKMINVYNIDIFSTILNKCIICYEYCVFMDDLDPFLYTFLIDIDEHDFW